MLEILNGAVILALLCFTAVWIVDGVWAVCQWVYGLRLLWGVHREDLTIARGFERSGKPKPSSPSRRLSPG